MHVDRTVLEPRGQITMSCMRSSTDPVYCFLRKCRHLSTRSRHPLWSDPRNGKLTFWVCLSYGHFQLAPGTSKGYVASNVITTMWLLHKTWWQCPRVMFGGIWFQNRKNIQSYSGDLEDLTSIRSYFMDIILERASGQFGGFLPWCGTTLMRMSNWSSQFCLRSTAVSP